MDPKLAELIERAAGKIVTGTVIAGALVGLGIYMRPGPPTYEMVASGNTVIRLNRESGAMIACTTERCVMLHRPGGRIERRAKAERPDGDEAKEERPAPAAPALPAPSR